MKKNSPKPKAKKKPSPNKTVAKSVKATFKPGTSPETAKLIEHVNAATMKPSKGSFMEDKRTNVRHEHTSHFTNRAPRGGK